MCVKGNQPGLRDAVSDRLRRSQPSSTLAHSRGHGRTEEGILAVVPADGIAFPGAPQAFRVIRHTGGLDGQRTRKEVGHGITNLSADQAEGEDAHRPRTGNAPAVLAAFRSVFTTALRLAGAANIAAARRAVALDPRVVILHVHPSSKPGQNAALTRP